MEPERLRASILSAKAGEAEGFETLSSEYGRRLYGYFYRATASHHDAEDMLGQMMLKLVKNIGRYDDRGRFDHWLFRIAANLVRDRIRRSKTNPINTSLSAEGREGTSLGDRLPGKMIEVDVDVLAEEASEELALALEKLDDTSRQMILLRHFAEMSFKEIAELFKCPLGTALARVHRGLRTLRNIMGPKYDTR